MLTVTVFNVPTQSEGGDKAATEGVTYDNIDFVSLVNNETYGPPALVAPGRDGASPTARPGQRVLFVNTNLVPLFEIERID